MIQLQPVFTHVTFRNPESKRNINNVLYGLAMVAIVVGAAVASTMQHVCVKDCVVHPPTQTLQETE